MIIQDLIDHFRKQVSDEAEPYLWDDEEVLFFITDAQDMFVRKIGGIADATTIVLTDLAVTTAVPFTAHSPYILRIRSGRLLTAKRDIDIISESGLSQITYDDYGIRRSTSLDDDDTGEVVAAVIGVNDKKLRWYKVPVADDTLRMHIYRLPYPRITSQESVLEIDDIHHYHLLKWVKHLAYSKQDAETYDKDAAEKNRLDFLAYCEEARRELERQRYKPRQTQYNRN